MAGTLAREGFEGRAMQQLGGRRGWSGWNGQRAHVYDATAGAERGWGAQRGRLGRNWVAGGSTSRRTATVRMRVERGACSVQQRRMQSQTAGRFWRVFSVNTERSACMDPCSNAPWAGANRRHGSCHSLACAHITSTTAAAPSAALQLHFCRSPFQMARPTQRPRKLKLRRQCPVTGVMTRASRRRAGDVRTLRP